MKLKYRLSLVAFGIILFLIVTPLLVLYARGFQIDWHNRSFIKTGTLVVKTDPAKAQVFLNGKLEPDTTPENIRFLIPGDYEVRIEKADYQVWTKRLNIRSQLVTWANDNRDFVALFLVQPKLLETYSAQDPKILRELPQIPEKPRSGPQPILSEKNILAFTQDGNTIWYIQKNFLKRINLDNNQIDIISTSVPAAGSAQIIRAENQIFAILDKNLYILNDTFEKIYDNVATATWDSISQRLVLANSHEILIYDPTSKNTDLIVRSTTDLKNPILNSATDYVFFQNEGKIKTIELDGRDHRNIYELVADLGNFTLSSDARTLYTFSDKEVKKYIIR